MESTKLYTEQDVLDRIKENVDEFHPEAKRILLYEGFDGDVQLEWAATAPIKEINSWVEVIVDLENEQEVD